MLFFKPRQIAFEGTVLALAGDRTTAMVAIKSGGDGYRYAAINAATEGHADLLNNTGTIQLGAKVSGVGKRGEKSVIATKVTRHG